MGEADLQVGGNKIEDLYNWKSASNFSDRLVNHPPCYFRKKDKFFLYKLETNYGDGWFFFDGVFCNIAWILKCLYRQGSSGGKDKDN